MQAQAGKGKELGFFFFLRSHWRALKNHLDCRLEN